MLITSATRSPVVSVETARFAEQELLRELERRRRHTELLDERRASEHGPRTAREPLLPRLRRAARAFVEVLRDADGATDGHRAPAPAHR